MTDSAPRTGDAAHELASSLSALLLGLQRLRSFSGGPERERALALIDRMETAVRGMSALLASLRAAPPAAPAAPGSPPPVDS